MATIEIAPTEYAFSTLYIENGMKNISLFAVPIHGGKASLNALSEETTVTIFKPFPVVKLVNNVYEEDEVSILELDKRIRKFT